MTLNLQEETEYSDRTTKPFTFRLRKDVRQQLAVCAIAQERSLAWVIQKAVLEYHDRLFFANNEQ